MLGLVALAMLAGDREVTAAPAARMELRKIADNVYVMQHPTGSSNSMFVVTDEGVVVWDGDIRTADQVFAAIRRTTDKKIRYHIISHPAGDHATGAGTSAKTVRRSSPRAGRPSLLPARSSKNSRRASGRTMPSMRRITTRSSYSRTSCSTGR